MVEKLYMYSESCTYHDWARIRGRSVHGTRNLGIYVWDEATCERRSTRVAPPNRAAQLPALTNNTIFTILRYRRMDGHLWFGDGAEEVKVACGGR